MPTKLFGLILLPLIIMLDFKNPTEEAEEYTVCPKGSVKNFLLIAQSRKNPITWNEFLFVHRMGYFDIYFLDIPYYYSEIAKLNSNFNFNDNLS